MPRTTPGAVQAILGPNWDGYNPTAGIASTDLTPFVYAASNVTDQVASLAAQRFQQRLTTFTLSGLQSATQAPMGSDSPNTMLELIERWLAAHFYCHEDPLYNSKSTGGASGSFQRGSDEGGFGTTEYGKAAVHMDPTGSLVILGKRQVAGALWLGKPPEDQRPWWMRW
jgi:hypothetical protein